MPTIAVAQDSSAIDPSVISAIEEFVQSEMSASRIPGVALSIVQGGETVHAAGFGSAGNGRDVTSTTVFPMGSIIKSFTAIAVLQLVETGDIDLDAPVQEYLPNFHVDNEIVSAQITVRHLLNQTSGLSRTTGNKPLVEHRAMTIDEVVSDLRSEKLNRSVGETYEYSNANFVVAASIVQEVSGIPFGNYLQTRILEPLGMVDSDATGADAARLELTAQYRYWFGITVEMKDAVLPERMPGEYLISTAEDMGRYLSFYLDDGSTVGGTAQILEPASIAMMLEPATNQATRQLLSTEFTFQYGMGWFAGRFGEVEDARWHLGELPAFNSWMVLIPERDLGLVVMINAGNQIEIASANEVFSRIPIGVANLLSGDQPPAGSSITRFYAVFNTVVLAFVALQVLSLVRLVRKQIGDVEGFGMVRFVTPLIWEIGLGVLILAGWPLVIQTGWRGSWMSFPDLTIVLIVVAVIFLGTALIRMRKLWLLVRWRQPSYSARAGTQIPAQGLSH